jgi:hypothetical protein
MDNTEAQAVEQDDTYGFDNHPASDAEQVEDEETDGQASPPPQPVSIRGNSARINFSSVWLRPSSSLAENSNRTKPNMT